MIIALVVTLLTLLWLLYETNWLTIRLMVGAERELSVQELITLSINIFVACHIARIILKEVNNDKQVGTRTR